MKLSGRETELRAQREAAYGRQQAKLVNTVTVNTSVNTKRVNTSAPVNTTRRSDRHSAGYMAAYMKRWRAKRAKGAA
jgi:FKBP-type peptidyl-prolyl cis-trans isomerase 2